MNKKKIKHYPIIHSRDVQRNFNLLKDALEEHGTVYISHYNKIFAKVVAEKKPSKKSEKEVGEFCNALDAVKGIGKINDQIDKTYDEIYKEEMMKKYGQ